MSFSVSLKVFPTAAILCTLGACSSSNTAEVATPFESQAVDGYIVGADVLCDGIHNGLTQSAGQFTCPSDTQLSKISGGYDVGTDAGATSGTFAFTGVLSAPTSEPFTTPMSTLSVALAQNDLASGDAFDLAGYEAAQATLAQTLDINLSLFSINPLAHLDAAKSNAMVHQILTAFALDSDGYEEATSAMATVIADLANTGNTISLTADVPATLMQINTKLMESGSSLTKATVDLNQSISNVTAANASIDSSESQGRVAIESQKALIDQAPVTIDRNNATVTLSNDSEASEQLTFEGFESSTQVDGLYTARLYSGMTRIDYDNSVFQFNQNIHDARVTVAFELTSVNPSDPRSITLFSDEIIVAAIKGQSESLAISMLSNKSTFQVHGTDSSGVTTKAVIETDGETLSSDGSAFSIDLERINRQLSDLGFEDILAESGDYSATLVISGLRINERDENETREAGVYTVNAGTRVFNGNGFRGYVSIVR